MAIYKNKLQEIVDKILPFKKRRQSMLKSILPYSYLAEYLINIPKLAKWEKKYHPEKVVKNRFLLYDYLNKEIIKNEKISYLEFRAFDDYSSSHMRDFKIICSTPNLVQVAIEFV